MASIGIVNNPRSRRNLRAPDTARRLRELLGPDGEVVDASTPEELGRAVELFRSAGIEVLGVNGGDGTLHVVLSAFAEAWGVEQLPRVAILRGGSMNTVADALGLRGDPESFLRAVLDGHRAGRPWRTVERDLLAVHAAGAPVRHGFLFGTGIFVTFLDAYYRVKRPTALAAAGTFLRAVASSVFGGPLAEELARRDPFVVRSDGEEWPDERYLTVAAGSVSEIGFGFRPFGRCDEQPGFFHAVGVTGSALQLAAWLPAMWLGRPWRRSLAFDAVARDLQLEAPRPFRYMMDGDLYEAPGQLRLVTGPSVRVIVP